MTGSTKLAERTQGVVDGGGHRRRRCLGGSSSSTPLPDLPMLRNSQGWSFSRLRTAGSDWSASEEWPSCSGHWPTTGLRC